ncbi:hypothetical protein CDD82_7725 [Ophiocordyceps australis]|uniref:Uncharacterized protein n=1 Tax=Ophiocordyceps australis TaxID=1399860 RepID=A0A2C5YUS1_9HYPO|nr:hypothetical protein CDD82_7725 [Ophiocordyceps australis]
MTWTDTALSRIALNTLRGAVLTTSCSVILLAEERRRRIKLAHATLENARKLRLIRNNRDAAALVQSSSWDSSLSPARVNVARDGSADNRPRTRGRRRRRRRGPSTTDSRASDMEMNHGGTASDHAPGGKPESSSASRAMKLDETARSRLPHVSRASVRELSTQSPLLRYGSLQATTMHRKNCHVRSFASTRPYGTAAPAAPLVSPQQAPSPTNPILEESDQMETKLSERREWLPSHVCEDATAALSRILHEIELLQEKENQATVLDRIKILGNIDSGIHVVEKLASHSHKLPKRFTDFQDQSQQLLRIALKYNCKETQVIVTALYSICCDHTGEAMRCLETIRRSESTRSVAAMEQVLSWLCVYDGLATCESGLRVYFILRRHYHKHHDYWMMAQLYYAMKKAGLFWKQMVHYSVEYKIRRYMLIMAIEHKDYDRAMRERDAIWQLDNNTADKDKGLLTCMAVFEAKMRNWASVSKWIERLRSVIKVGPVELNVLLGQINNILTRKEVPQQVDRQLRIFWSEFGFTPTPKCAYDLLVSYSKHRQLEEMVSWLEFCGECGINLEQFGLRQKYAWIFRKYWSFGDRSIAALYKRVEDVLTLSKGSKEAKEKEDVGGRNHSCGPDFKLYEQDEDVLPLGKGRRGGKDKEDVGGKSFKCRRHFKLYGAKEKALTLSKGSQKWQDKEAVGGENYDWGSKWQLSDFKYGIYQRNATWTGYSVRKLVVDLLTPPSARGISDAWQAILEAKAQGQDVAEAFTPLLLACLDRGDRIDGVVEELPAAGIRVHDSVYNRMARGFCFAGDQEASIRVCYLASVRNGKGNLVYNSFNFANLVLGYVFSGQNWELTRVLETFLAKKLWWCGAPECEENIKMAIRVLGKRIVRHQSATREEDYCIELLNEALRHVKEYRANSKHRMAISNAYIEALQSCLARKYGPGAVEPEVTDKWDSCNLSLCSKGE